MSSKVKEWLLDRIKKIESGQFTDDDVRLLFIDLRDCVEGNQPLRDEVPLLYDLFNVCAHPGQRNRGLLFKQSRNLVCDFIEAIRSGGVVAAKELEIDMFASLMRVYDALDLQCRRALFLKQIPDILKCIYRIAGDTKLIIDNDAIEYCELKYSDNPSRLLVSFKVKPFSHVLVGGLTVSGEPTIQFVLL